MILIRTFSSMGCKPFSTSQIVPIASSSSEINENLPVVIFRKEISKENENEDEHIEFFDDKSDRTGLINYNGTFVVIKRNIRSAASDSRLIRSNSSLSDRSVLSSPRIRSVSPIYQPVRIVNELRASSQSISSNFTEETIERNSSNEKMLKVIETHLKSTSSILSEPNFHVGSHVRQISLTTEEST